MLRWQGGREAHLAMYVRGDTEVCAFGLPQHVAHGEREPEIVLPVRPVSVPLLLPADIVREHLPVRLGAAPHRIARLHGCRLAVQRAGCLHGPWVLHRHLLSDRTQRRVHRSACQRHGHSGRRTARADSCHQFALLAWHPADPLLHWPRHGWHRRLGLHGLRLVPLRRGARASGLRGPLDADHDPHRRFQGALHDLQTLQGLVS
mmetsp:Transcript_76905/g.199974  ORF Transcript_76905/g.199974 Transcript_76905/m.199974 type:complete len:204 (+) Transcript_76905:2357-2968(+)